MTQRLQHERFLRRTPHPYATVLYRRSILLVLLSLLFFAGVGTYRAFFKYRDSEIMLSKAQSELADLKDRHEVLKGQMANLETERGKEGLLRERYGLAKEGEQMIVIIDSKNEVATSTPVQKEQSWIPSFLR